jgi:hypothetical protein
MYHPYKKYIILYERAYSLSESDFNALLEHEWSHKVYWDEFTTQEVRTWEAISRFDTRTLNEVKKKWTDIYWINKYISPNETNESEDFAETIEDIFKNPKNVYNDYRDIKRKSAVKLMQRH